MGKRDKSTPRKRGGNDANGAYPFKPVKIRIMKVVSLFFFICSCSLFVVFVARLSLVPFEEYPRVKVLIDYVHNDIKAYQKILAWWGTHIDETSARTLLPVMGIFNFTYTQILAARGQRLYGLSLHEAIKAHFPWSGVAYAMYAVWIVAGLFVRGGSLIVPFCFAGVFSSFLSALIISCLFVTSRANAQCMVEMYLLDYKNPKSRYPSDNGTVLPSDVKDYLRMASVYVREYYKDSGDVPGTIILHIWDRFTFDISDKGMPVITLREEKAVRSHRNRSTLQASVQQPDKYVQEGIDTVRFIWENSITGLSWDKQADLAAKVIQVLSNAVPDEGNQQKRGDQETYRIPNVYRRLGMPLCGLVSFLRNQTPPPEYWKEYFNGLNQCIAQVYKISGGAPGAAYVEEEPLGREKYIKAVQLLFLLLEATIVTESLGWRASMLARNKDLNIWRKLYGMCLQLDVPLWEVSRFLSWGQCIVNACASEWSGAENGIMSI